MLPFVIHSDTMANRSPVMTTPISSNTFGCRRDFQVMTSLQNLYKKYGQFTDTHRERNRSTFTRLLHFLQAETLWPQSLDRDLPTTTFTSQNVRKSTAVPHIIHRVPG